MNFLMPKFELGRIYATSSVTSWASIHNILLDRYLRRHHCGDWGDLSEEDKQANEDAIRNENRILSAYLIGDDKIYIITEWDRSYTTILFSNEY